MFYSRSARSPSGPSSRSFCPPSSSAGSPSQKFPAEPSFSPRALLSLSSFWGFGNTKPTGPWRRRKLCLIRSIHLQNPTLLPDQRPDLQFQFFIPLQLSTYRLETAGAKLVGENCVSMTLDALTLYPAYRILRFRAVRRRVTLPNGSIYADSGDRENLAQRKVDQLGRRQVARPFARGELRLRGLRRHPLLRNQAGPGHFPLARAHAAAHQLRKNLPHGASL